MDQSRPLFVYYRPFYITARIEKANIVLGIWTRGRKMRGADGSIEQW